MGSRKGEFRQALEDSAQAFKDKSIAADERYANAFLSGEFTLLVLLGFVSFGIPRIFPQVQIGTVFSFVLIFLYLIGPITALLNSLPMIAQIRVSWTRLQSFLKSIPAEKDPKTQLDQLRCFETLRLENIGYRYDESGFELGPINLDMTPGEIVFVVGGNGSGKTTLVKLLAGLYQPQSGQITIDGQQVTGKDLAENLSVIFNPAYLFKDLYGVEIRDYEEVDHYLQMLDLQKVVSLRDRQFSSTDVSTGQKKRLALLQALLEDRPVFLFDEWAADQDPGFRKFFYNTILPELKNRGKLIIAITHDDQYFHVADSILKLVEGKYVVEATEVFH